MARQTQNQNEQKSFLPQSALVIDTDNVVLQLIKNHLSAMGVKRVQTFENGREAWESVQKDPPEMVIMDWKLPEVSGVCLYNRLRQTLSMSDKPILAISGTLVRDDFRLLEEYPCTAFLAKPFSRKVLQEDLEKLQADYYWLRQHSEQISQVLRRIAREGGDAIKQMKAMMAGSPNPIPIALIAVAKLQEFEFVAEAEQLLRQILKIAPHSIVAMNELGKMLHLQGKHGEALRILEKAIEYSPKNLARLCLIGEVQLNMGDTAQARENFQRALDIDPNHERAAQGLLLANNITEYISQKANDKAGLPHQFASILNTIGISKVRSGRFDEGIKQYRAAVAFVHSPDVAARLAFNVGLAYLRMKRFQDALGWFEKAWELSEGRMIKTKKYIFSLRRRLGSSVQRPVASSSRHASDHSRATAQAADGEELTAGDEESFELDEVS